jgi:hypothetical protein
MENRFSLFFNFKTVVSENIVTPFDKKLKFCIKALFATAIVAALCTGVLLGVISVEFTFAMVAHLSTSNSISIRTQYSGFGPLNRVAFITQQYWYQVFVASLAIVTVASFIATGVVGIFVCV